MTATVRSGRLRERPAAAAATPGADKTYDVAGLVADLRALNVTPHVAQNTANRRSAIDGRTTRHPGHATSQRLRQRIEESFGWIGPAPCHERGKRSFAHKTAC
jgi:hypothetical protein